MIGNESQCYTITESKYFNIPIVKEEEEDIDTNNSYGNINVSSEKDIAVINEANKILNSIIKSLKNNDIESLLYTTSEIENPNFGELNSIIEKIIIQVYDSTIKALDDAFFNNVSSINIGTCENYLKETYNIPDNESIRILKLDIVRSDMKVHQVGYEFYSENGTLLEPNNCNVIVSISSEIKYTR
jgi:hypothetical protein